MVRTLPLFPLTVVLFPGAPLPLHIFEPRYRRLLADCLAGDERFGILPPGPGGAPPAPGTVGCIGHVRATQPLPDGRTNIVVIGESRFTVEDYEARPDLPYLVARVREFDDAPGPPVAAELALAVRSLFLRWVEAMRTLGDAGDDGIDWPDEPEAFSLQAAGAIEADYATRRALLELRSTAERFERLLALLGPLAEDASQRAAVHVRARGNGKGGHHPDIVTE